MLLPAIRDVAAIPHSRVAIHRIHGSHDDRDTASQPVRLRADLRGLGPPRVESVGVHYERGILFLLHGEQYRDGYIAAGAADPDFVGTEDGVEGQAGTGGDVFNGLFVSALGWCCACGVLIPVG